MSRCFGRSTRTLVTCLELGPGAPYEFICECSTSGCFERLSLTLEEYERVREDGTHFLLADGHEDIEIEQVIAHRAAYVVVENTVSLDLSPTTMTRAPEVVSRAHVWASSRSSRRGL